ncbi:MAG: iron-containing redox enzyme family protein [Planctomycetes bacterium]|nr:iron-containing redox enzyme family protein [Planctomycetota bacterium]
MTLVTPSISRLDGARIDFGPLAAMDLAHYERVPERTLFYTLLHIDEHSDALPTAFELAAARLKQAEQFFLQIPEHFRLPDYKDFVEQLPAMRDWWLQQQEALKQALGGVSWEQCVHLVTQYAPTALLDGCWLQNISSSATSHTELTAGLLKLYSSEVGDGYCSQHHGNAYRDLIRSMGIYLPEVESIAFVEQRELVDAAFRHPVYLLCLSQFPRAYAPEIVGITLFYYVCGICPVLPALRNQLQQRGAATRFLDLHQLETSFQAPANMAVEIVERFMDSCADEPGDFGEELWSRIRRGFLAGWSDSSEAMDRAVRLARAPRSSPREKMLELISRKARHAFGYHQESLLEGRSIDDWMNPEHLDAPKFLDALARSRFVTPGNAKGSYFFKRLVEFRGPMFRIFSPDELQVITEWIDGLPAEQPQATPADGPVHQVPAVPWDAGVPGRSPEYRAAQQANDADCIKRYSRMPLGDVYYYLLNIEQFPDVRPFAKYFATRWLTLAGRKLTTGKRPLPFAPYRHQALDKWLDDQHSAQVASYHPTDEQDLPSRDQLIESSIQQAPMILIDGAWIQHAAGASTSHTPVGSKLFHIYVDEVGNGDATMNHPNVYRELLAQMGIELPEFATLEFSRWPGFRPDSFQVPVFWLSISQFPKRFLAETLGLNLAMELSGVGGTYRSLIDALRHYGFDPCFVELHNTIDNVSTGHTAWAIEAIKDYLDDIFARGGADMVNEHWHRIWTGYRSLVPPRGLKNWFYRIF